MGLWGFQWEDDESGDDGSYVAMQGTRWEWWRVLLRIAATPLTLAADAGIGAIEGAVSALLGGDDDDDPERHSSCRGSSPRVARAPSSGGTPIRNGVVRTVR